MAVKIGTLWSDIDHRIVSDASGQIKLATNVQAVMTSVDNILRTSRGERVMLPEFGSSLKNMVFENMNSPLLDVISQSIKDDIETWDDRVEVTQVRYLQEPDNNNVILEVSFKIKGYYKIFKQEVRIKGETA